ncbi:unnamed protein product [Linum tenue]|uniref:Uncharacterized protein n=1 Tax=Linum tenue TaxID=586396 RepID=A0AAV0H4N1_9ROSI|nr:unnamed protein product [Linum tenue]
MMIGGSSHCPTCKRRKKARKIKDRLSKLPDHLLRRILSSVDPNSPSKLAFSPGGGDPSGKASPPSIWTPNPSTILAIASTSSSPKSSPAATTPPQSMKSA